MERGRGLIFGLAFSFVRILRAFVLCPHWGPIVMKITNLVIFPLSFAVIFRTMRVGIVSLWIRINVSSWDEVAICGTMPSIINTYRILMSIGYTLICDLAHVFRAFFFFCFSGCLVLLDPLCSRLKFLFCFRFSCFGLGLRLVCRPIC